MQLVFDKYDTNGDGVLDTSEVAAMLDALNFDVNANYIGDVMGQFGEFDTSSDGVIDIRKQTNNPQHNLIPGMFLSECVWCAEEFARLWEHLDGEPLAEIEPELASAVETPTGMSAEDAAVWPSEWRHRSFL